MYAEASRSSMDSDLIKKQKKNNLITGRGATAIYLSLANEGLEGIDVLVPGNICYAAVYPIISSGNNVVFCDVDNQSGNLNLDIIEIYKTKKTKAIIVPHMYGNSVNELDVIKEWCERNEIIMIEDCASSLGSENSKYGMCGHIGDYVVYSFGYSKIVDIGEGGLLSSNKNLDKAKRLLEEFPLIDRTIEEQNKLLYYEYRIARYKTSNYTNVKNLFNDHLFLNRIKQKDIDELFCDGFIDDSIKKHHENYNIYNSLLNKNLVRYKYNEGSVPWRFSLLLDKKTKKEIIDTLLFNNLPVSDWYPNVTVLFNEHKKFLPGVDMMEEKIINFPLDINEETIKKICVSINNAKG